MDEATFDYKRMLEEFEKYEKPDRDLFSPVMRGRMDQDLFAWETSMTDPSQHSDSRFRYLVHAVWPKHSSSRLVQTIAILEKVRAGAIEIQDSIDLLEHPERIVDKPIISTSLIDRDHLATWAPGGYILRVPVDNVLQTASSDCGTDFMGFNGDALQRLYDERDRLGIAHPDAVLDQTSPRVYNEIVVAGTGKTGKKVEIVGVFVKTSLDGRPVDRELSEELSEIAYRNRWPQVRLRVDF